MPEVRWNPKANITYGEIIEESIFSARAIYQDADGDNYSPAGTYNYTYSGTTSGTLATGVKLDAGSYTLTVTFDPTDGALGANITANVSFEVKKAVPLVIWNNPPPLTYALDGDGNGPTLTARELNAESDIAGDFVYSPVLGTSLDAGEQIVTATFTPTGDDADNYESLPTEDVPLEIEFEVLKGEIVIEVPVSKNGLYEKIFLPKKSCDFAIKNCNPIVLSNT